jgi:23S rRNA (adenine2503-C2)-methyltransferase
MTKTDLKNYDLEGLIRYVEDLGQPAFRGRQIMSWLYRPGITEFEQMTDIAKKFREILKEKAFVSRFSEPILERSTDGSVKFGFHLADGKIVESVLIPEEDRNTLCLSSQVGCAMGCTFCLTGTMGFIRNLTPAEMVNQVCAVRDFLLAEPAEALIGPREVTNLVFMGMGEPLNNLDNLLTALSILTDPKGLDLTGRKITVSTCGIAPKLRKLGENSTVNLAISLHAVDNAIRNTLMPVNKLYPLDVLFEACRNFPMPKRRRIMFEYILFKDINDSDEQAYELARKLHKIPCKINLLPYNESPDFPYRSPAPARIFAFQKILLDKHYSVFIRSSRGSDISAACGQLAGKAQPEASNPHPSLFAPKPTALRVAELRAVHQLLDSPLVFPDPLALKIIGETAEEAIRKDPLRLNEPLLKGLRTSLVVRSRLAEDEWARSYQEGLRQYVILGAGLDTFAYRNGAQEDLRIFEVDLQETQQWKRECLRAAGIAVPASLTFVPADFESLKLSQALKQAGFHHNEPAFFSWLGVTMYLDESAILQTLEFIATLAPGSAVVFDYGVAPSLLSLREQKIMEVLAKKVAERCEPWKTFFDPAALTELLSSLGFKDTEEFGPDEMNRRYLSGRTDGLRKSGLTRLICARV